MTESEGSKMKKVNCIKRFEGKLQRSVLALRSARSRGGVSVNVCMSLEVYYSTRVEATWRGIGRVMIGKN